MKELKNMHRHVIVYLPGGGEKQYSTKDLSDKYITVAESIVCEDGIVNVIFKQDDKIEGRAYSGMPYILNLF